MRRCSALLSLILLASFATAQQSPSHKTTEKLPDAPGRTSASLPSEVTVDLFLKHMFAYDPDISWRILHIGTSPAPGLSEVVVAIKSEKGQENLRFYVTPDGEHAIPSGAEIIPFGSDPFARARAELAAGADGPSRGPAKSTINIVEFSDLECPSCRAAQPTIDKLLADLPNAHFTFQNFPLQQIHPWAFKAAAYDECVAAQSNDAFWKFVATVYGNQSQITAENADQKLREYAGESGVNGDKVAACATQPATAERVRRSIALGEKLNVRATPTLFINGRQIESVNGIPYETLKAIAEHTPSR
ncbi:MAG: DsbA family protein [Terriglobales bacterium]